MTQSSAILAHLQTRRPLTPLEALQQYGCLRLAARIADLRAAGYRINTERCTLGGKSFARYWLA